MPGALDTEFACECLARAPNGVVHHTDEAAAAHRGFTCLDWTDLKHHYRKCNIVTVPIEAPEGVLGALTGAAGPEKTEQDLTSEMQALSKSLAHSLTFCKCKSDLQVTYLATDLHSWCELT